MLRDIDGLSSREVCEVLEISEANQRVLLHRGRSHLRQALEADWGVHEMFWDAASWSARRWSSWSPTISRAALSRSQRRRFEAHLAGCEHCTEYLEQMRATIRLTGGLQSEDMTPEMREEFPTLYRRWRAEEDELG